MRFDSGQEVFARVTRNYVITEYVPNENDRKTLPLFRSCQFSLCVDVAN